MVCQKNYYPFYCLTIMTIGYTHKHYKNKSLKNLGSEGKLCF